MWVSFLTFLPLQGLMFGYATNETEECMPLTIVLAHKLNAKMAELRRNGTLPWLRPDSKTQVDHHTCHQLPSNVKYTGVFPHPLVLGYCPVPPGPWCHAPSACAHNCHLCPAWWGYLPGGDERGTEGEDYQSGGSLHLSGWWHHLPLAAQWSFCYWRPTGRSRRLGWLLGFNLDNYVPCHYHRVMLAWLDVKSSLTRMVVGGHTEVGPSLGRTTPRWTGRLLMLLVGLPSLWWRLASANACWSRCVDVATHLSWCMCTGAFEGILIFKKIKHICLSGVVCNWSCPPSVNLHLPLWDLPQEWERAAWHCEEELWPPPWSHCQVVYNLKQTAPFRGSFTFCFTFQFNASLFFFI